MDPNQEPKEQQLSSEEVEEMRDGQSLYEMTQSSGWRIVKRMLEELAFHSWSDPRQAKSLEEWAYREINSFYGAANAKELIESIQVKIDRADHLSKVRSGEINKNKFRF